MNKYYKSILLGCFFSFEVFAKTSFTGIISPAHDIELTLPIEGKVSSIYLKEGDKVLENEKILKLDDKMQLLETRRRNVIYKDNSEIFYLKKNERILKEMLRSTKELYNRTKSISKDEVLSLEIKYYDVLGELLTKQEAKKREKIEYEISKEVLASHTLKSPINGVITKIELDVGEWTSLNKSVVNIVDNSKCFVEINIDEKYAKSLKLGDSVNLKIKSKNSFVNQESKIIFISPIADNSSGLVRIKTEFNNKNNKFTPGLSAIIEFDDDKKEVKNKDGLVNNFDVNISKIK